MKLYGILPGQLVTRGRFDGWTLERKLRELEDAQISVVVCLRPKQDTELSVAMGELYRWYPMSDGKKLDAGRVESIADEIVDFIYGHHKVLVHCNAGRNRAGLVASLVVSRILAISGADALRHVRSIRREAVGNPVFEEYLLSRKGLHGETEGTKKDHHDDGGYRNGLIHRHSV